MHEIQKKKLLTIIKELNVLPVEYAIRVTDSGELVGTLPIQKEKVSKHKVKRPRAVNKDYSAEKIKERISGMKQGDVIVFDIHPPLTMDDMQGNVGAICCLVWGKGNCSTFRNRTNNNLEVLRMA